MVLTDDTHTQRRCPGYHGTFYATPSFRVTAAATGEHGRTAVYPSVEQHKQGSGSQLHRWARITLAGSKKGTSRHHTDHGESRSYIHIPACSPPPPSGEPNTRVSLARARAVRCYLGMLCRPLLNDLPFPPPPLLVSWSLEVLRRSTLRSGDSFFPLMFAGERRPSRG